MSGKSVSPVTLADVAAAENPIGCLYAEFKADVLSGCDDKNYRRIYFVGAMAAYKCLLAGVQADKLAEIIATLGRELTAFDEMVGRGLA